MRPSETTESVGNAAARYVGGKDGKVHRPLRLLLVDDDPAIGRMIGQIAADSGFAVEVATRANAFKAAYESRRPDVIGLDLAIPECDGFELLRYLADTKCQAQILIVSGIDDGLRNAAKRLGEGHGLKMAEIISKPMRTSEIRVLLSRVRQMAS